MPTNDTPTAAGATNVLLNQRSLDPPYYRQAVGIQGDENAGKAIGFDNDGLLGAIPIPITVGAVGDGGTDDTEDFNDALAAAAAAAVANGKGAVACEAGKSYLISSAIAIPDNVCLDISACTVTSTVAGAFTFGENSVLIATGASIVTSGGAGAALKKTSLDPEDVNGVFIFGWPRLLALSPRVAGSIGVDLSGSYKGVIEVTVSDYETGISMGGDVALSTYYNTLSSPRVSGAVTGIKLGPGANCTVILNPQINGSSVGTYGIHADGVAALTIVSGWLEQFADAAATRGIWLNDVSIVTITGTVLETLASTTANYAIGITGESTQVQFLGAGFASAWGAGDGSKMMSHTASGTYSFIGGAPANQIIRLGQSGWTAGEANGTLRATRIAASMAAAADTAHTLVNTEDGITLRIENNSAGIGANRAVQIINRLGGPGFALGFQNNGNNAGGIVFGAGNPNGVVSAVPGTLYCNTSGGANVSLYVKESATDASGWVAK